MNRNKLLKKCLPNTVCVSLVGQNADELSIEQFDSLHKKIFDAIFEVNKADICEFKGYGELDENQSPQYKTLKGFLEGTFSENVEGYWRNWKELFNTSLLTKEFFDEYYKKMELYSQYCEGERYLVNNNTFLANIVVTSGKVAILDWSRVAITDWMLDFVIMDLNKPYFKVPEKLFDYLSEKGIEVKNFKERFLCMAYYKGLDTLRWHASIDDEESCKTIMKSMSALEERIHNL